MTGPTQVLLWCVRAFVYGTVTLCGRPFHVKIPLTTHNPILESYNPARKIPTVWALPISLAATDGIDFSFSSSGYLDVSVHQVRLLHLWIQCRIPLRVGFPIRTSPDQSLFADSPKLFAGYNVLHRL